MKSNFLRLSMVFVASLGLFLGSCKKDDGDPPVDPCTNGVQDPGEEGVDCGGTCPDACPVNNVLPSSIDEDTTLDSSIAYQLNGTLSVNAGSTLTIPAGTTITTASGTDVYIVVQQGADIVINGTATNPVVMTASAAQPGSWGGLVIAGNATTTEGVNATAEVGGISYGGTEDADNSGSIDYLVINYAGAQINPESQFNGLTLYAVGSGTSISNVALLNGTDDGVEFFGGTVSASNFYFENNEDDSVDWTEGWNGTLSNAFVLHTINNFSTAVEADGVNGNPTLENFTAISAGTGSKVGGTALQFKKASGATINGLSLTGYDTNIELANPDQGSFENIIIDGAASNPDASYLTSTEDGSGFAWASDNSGSVDVLTGSLTSDLSLDAGVTYFLEGTYSVESGATLTIPAGTSIVADLEVGEATSTYIVVQQGGAIDVQGTASNPVVFTSSTETPGSWGGLVMAGFASTTEGVDATAEVGQINYGGTDDADSSGNIDYLIINYAGAQINPESQFNGLSLYAVGSGTTIDNVAILNGTDDGVEFFGGTVSASNFYLENNEDDAVDWTEGWNGTLTDAYVLHTAGFSTAVEADGANGNPTLANFTAVSTVGGTALQFKKASGATITGLSLTGYATSVELANPDQGSFANILIDGVAADPNNSYLADATVDVSQFSWANGSNVETQVLTGQLDADLTLDANVEYFLSNTFSVESGATLTIPAGTKITADLAVGEATSTYIVVQQGGAIDVQGTASEPVIFTSTTETPGSWGGLVMAGFASTTEGVDATAEVGQINYGGEDDADSSGNIDYLIINYAGAQINPESQFNGLSLYAVGSGTTIDNVAILNGTDDGVEFFGGTVSASNFYLENNEDDAVDWTEGWNGTLTNASVVHTAAFSTAVEADGANGNPTLTNFTAVSTVGGTALQFKKASGATITGLSLSGYTTSVELANPDQGSFDNILIDGVAADPANTYLADPTVDSSLFDWVPNKTTITTKVLTGSITEDLTLDSQVAYFLSNTFSVESGATLTIPAGTSITADLTVGEATSTYIVVQQGGAIDVQGTANNPVVMTSSTQTPGSWGGLVIAGFASTTEGVDATAEVGQINYGGTDDADSSGNIDYLIINYAGAQINPESQFNGLSLYAVGSGTTIDNVAILNGTDDGVEFFGGTVSASNFYLENNEDDAVDWTEGWNGTLTNAYVVHDVAFSTAVEADGANGNPTLTNFTAVSSQGGTALQFKKASGATITGLSLTGYATSVELANPDQGSFANILIDGVAADPANTYNAAATVDIMMFDWATGN